MIYRDADHFFREIFSEDFIEESKLAYDAAFVAGRAFNAVGVSGLSRKEIACRMGLESPSLVDRIVDADEVGSVSISMLIRFCNACGLSFSDVFSSKE